MTHATAIARADHFESLAAAMFYEAETAARARLFGDAAELTARATRACGTAAAYRKLARKAH